MAALAVRALRRLGGLALLVAQLYGLAGRGEPGPGTALPPGRAWDGAVASRGEPGDSGAGRRYLPLGVRGGRLRSPALRQGRLGAPQGSARRALGGVCGAGGRGRAEITRLGQGGESAPVLV